MKLVLGNNKPTTNNDQDKWVTINGVNVLILGESSRGSVEKEEDKQRYDNNLHDEYYSDKYMEDRYEEDREEWYN